MQDLAPDPQGESDYAAVRGAAQAVVEVAARLGSAAVNAAMLRSCLRLPYAQARAFCSYLGAG